MTPDAIDVKVEGTVHTYAEKDIRLITRTKSDSPLNGILIGAAGGFGSTLPINLAYTGRDEKGVAIAASVLWGLIGGGIGAVVDACVHQKQMVYFRLKTKRNDNYLSRIIPIYFPDRQGRRRWGESTLRKQVQSPCGTEPDSRLCEFGTL